MVRALALGYGLVAGDRRRRTWRPCSRGSAAPRSSADEDETSRLGLVLAVGGRRARPAGRWPPTTSGPLARDQHGHVQRLPPAVLATWSMATDAWDHFAWGVVPELAERLGVRPVELEREQARRAAALAATAGTGDPGRA